MIKLLVFDLDGVITSEGRYWNTSRLTVWDIFTNYKFLGLNDFFSPSLDSPQQALTEGKLIISDGFIRELKQRAVNSNWDLTYFVVSLYLISIMENVSLTQDIQGLSFLEQLQSLGKQVTTSAHHSYIIEQFWQETQDIQGTQVSEYLVPFSKRVIGRELSDFLSLDELWTFCYQLFQDWYEGRRGFTLPDDQTVLDVGKIEETLVTLSQHYDLGIATGRPRNEVIEPLTKLGILKYFNPQRIVTYDEVLEAQAYLNNKTKLGKPHPFILYKAISPHLPLEEILNDDFILEQAAQVAYIGDAGSDVVAAKKAKCLSIGVLTGFSTAQSLLKLGCDIIVQDITHLMEVLG